MGEKERMNLPWRVLDDGKLLGDPDSGDCIHDSDGTFVAEFQRSESGAEMRNYAIRACNAYPKLLAELKDALHIFYLYKDTIPQADQAIRGIEAAIAAARPRENGDG